MRYSFKRFLALALTIMMVMTMMPVDALAGDSSNGVTVQGGNPTTFAETSENVGGMAPGSSLSISIPVGETFTATTANMDEQYGKNKRGVKFSDENYITWNTSYLSGNVERIDDKQQYSYTLTLTAGDTPTPKPVTVTMWLGNNAYNPKKAYTFEVSVVPLGFTVKFFKQEPNTTAVYDTKYAKDAALGTDGMPDAPTSDTHDFDGWYTLDADGNQTTFDAETEVKADVDVYAKWAAKPVVTFYEDDTKGTRLYTKYVTGGTLSGNMPDDPAREGFRFDGWFTKDANDAEIAFSDSSTVAGNMDVYAKWTQKHLVSFYENEGDAEPLRTFYTLTELGTDMPKNLDDTPDKAFDGWYTTDGEKFTAQTPVTGDIDVYARWNNIYTVSFYKLEGDKDAYDTKKTETGKVALPTNPTRKGYFFDSWTLADGTAFTAETPVTESVSVYAKWTHDDRYYTVRFFDMLLERLDENPQNPLLDEQQVLAGSTADTPDGYALPSGFDESERTHTVNGVVYRFTGWNTTAYQNVSGEDHTIDVNAVFIADTGDKNNDTDVAQFYIRYDGVIPNEPLAAGFGTGAYTSVGYGRVFVGTLSASNMSTWVVADDDNNNNVTSRIVAAPDIQGLKSNEEVYWYVLKRHNNGIHVDGVIRTFNTYKVRYNVNVAQGGDETNASNAIADANSYKSGQVATVVTNKRITNTNPYARFLGWSTDPNASVPAYRYGKSETLVIEDHDVVLYAVFADESTTISASKVWLDGGARQHDEIVVDLYQNGNLMGDAYSVTLSDANNWKANFLLVPSMDSNQSLYQYTVQERSVPDGYAVKYNGSTVINYEIGSVTVSKAWYDTLSDHDEVVVTLYRSVDGGNAMECGTAILGASGQLEHTFENLPLYNDKNKPYTYTVSETTPEGYTAVYGGSADANGVVTFGNDNTATATISNVKPYYTVRYLEQSTNDELHASKTVKENVAFGTAYPETKENIAGYKVVGDDTQTITLTPDMVIAGENKLTFYYTNDDIAYTVHHYLYRTDINGGTPVKVAEDSDPITVTSGTEVVITAAASANLKTEYSAAKAVQGTGKFTVDAQNKEFIVYYKIPLTIKAGDASKPYDGTPLTCAEVEIKEGALLAGDQISAVMTDASAITNVKEGVVDNVIASTGLPSYYDVTAQKGELKITPVELKVYASTTQSKTYGEADDPVFTYTADVGANNETPGFNDGKLVRVPGEDAGTYRIYNNDASAEKLALDDNGSFLASNYVLKVVDGLFTINSIDKVFAAQGYEGVYDGREHGVTVTGVDDGDTVEYRYKYGNGDFTEWSETAPTFTDVTIPNGADSATVEVRASGMNHTYAAIDPVYVKITPRTVQVTAHEKTKKWNEDDPTLTYEWKLVTYASDANPAVLGDTLTLTGEGGLTRDPGEEVGKQYEIKRDTLAITGTREGGTFKASNYVIEYTGNYLTIIKADTSTQLTATDVTVPYDGKAHVVEVEGKLADDTLYYSLTGADGSWEDDYTKLGVKNVVLAQTMYVKAVNPLYADRTAQAAVTIIPAEITVTARNATKVYGKNDPVPFLYEKSNGVKKDDGTFETPGFDGALTRVAGEEVGPEYAIERGNLTLKDGTNGFLASNYTLQFVDGVFTITKATAADITVTKYEGAYDAAAHNVTVTGNGLPGDETYYSVTGEDGSWDQKLSFTDVTASQTVYVEVRNNNYETRKGEATVTITSIPLTLKVNNQEITYGDSLPTNLAYGAVEGMPEALADKETPALSGSPAWKDMYKDADTYTGAIEEGSLALVDNGAFKAANYTLTVTAGDLIIKRAVITVTPTKGLGKVYGNTDPTLTYEPSGTKYGETARFETGTALARESGEDVKQDGYPILKGTLELADGAKFKATNYTLQVKDEVFTITKRPINVTADDVSLYYKQSLPASYSVTIDHTMTANGETAATEGQPACAYTKDNAGYAAVGEYPITKGAVALTKNGTFNPDNYEMNFIDGKLTIQSLTDAGLAVTPYSGLYDGEEHTVTVSLNNKTGDVTYYSTKPNLPEDSTDWLTELPKFKDVTNATVYVMVKNPQYNTRFASGAVTITPRPLYVQANAYEMNYGATVDAASLTWGEIKGSTLSAEKPTLNQGGLKLDKDYSSASVGSYENAIVNNDLKLVDNGNFKASNYSFEVEPGTLTIKKAPVNPGTSGGLTVTGGEKVYDGIALGVTVTGALESDRLTYTTGDPSDPNAVWSKTPITFTNVTETTVYVKAENDNYDTRVESAVVKITKRPLTLTADDQTMVYGGDESEIELTMKVEAADAENGLVQGEVPAYTGALAITAGTTANRNAGEYPDVITQGTLALKDNGDFLAGNYEIAQFNPGKLTVTRRKIVAIPDDKEKLSGDADPDFTWTVRTGVSGEGALAGETEKITGSLTRENVGTEVSDTYEIHEDDTHKLALSDNGAFLAQNYVLSVLTGKLTIRGSVRYSVRKDWVDTQNPNARPTSVTVGLYQNDVYQKQYVTLAEGAWTGTFSKVMPAQDAQGNMYAYTVREIDPNTVHADAPTLLVPDGYAPTYSTEGSTLVITNTLETYGYTIRHLLYGTNVSVAPDDEGTIYYGGTVTAAKSKQMNSGYEKATVFECVPAYPVTADGSANSIVITVYYKVPLKLTAGNSLDNVYSGSPVTQSAFTAEGLVNGNTEADITAPMTKDSEITNVGNTPNVIDTNKIVAPDYYTVSTVSGKLEVVPATITVTATQGLWKYFGANDPNPFPFTATGAKNGETIVTAGKLSREPGDNVRAQPYLINQGTLALDDGKNGNKFLANNYKIVYVGAGFEIRPVDAGAPTAKVTLTGYQGQYDGAEHTLTVSGQQTGDTLYYCWTQPGDTTYNGWTTTVPTFKNVTGDGSETDVVLVKVKAVAPTVNGKQNFEDRESEPATVRIWKAEIIVQAIDQEIAFGDPEPALTYEMKQDGVNPELAAFSGALKREAGNAVNGDPGYAITNDTLALENGQNDFLKDNYFLTVLPGKLIITRGTADAISATGFHVTYDGKPHEITVTGDLPNDTLYYRVGANGTWYDWPQGGLTYTDAMTEIQVYVKAVDPSGNIADRVTQIPATAQIDPAVITVAADSQDKTYGDIDKTLTYKPDGGQNGEVPAFNGVLERKQGEDVGIYAIGQGSLKLANNGTFKASNYTLSYTRENLTITPATLTVTADPQNKIYGDNDPETLTYQYEGAKGSDKPVFSGALKRVAGEDVGDYAIEQNGLKLVGGESFKVSNYVLEYVRANLTIEQATITVTADPQTKNYGAGDPTLTYGNDGAKFGETPMFTGALTRVAGEDAGKYDILQGDLALVDGNGFKVTNYKLAYNGDKLTILPVDGAAISASGFKGPYDADAHTVTVSGVGDDTLYYRWKLPGKSVYESDWTIVKPDFTNVTGGAVIVEVKAVQNGVKNYNDRETSATIEITKAQIVVRADDKSKIYGKADPDLTFTVTKDGVKTERAAFTGSLTRERGEDVNTVGYAIDSLNLALADGENGFLAKNYDLTVEPGTLTITQGTADAISASGFNVIYDGKPHEVTVGGTLDTDEIFFRLSENDPWTRWTQDSKPAYTDAMDRITVYVMAHDTTGNVADREAAANAAIGRAVIRAVADPQTKPYGDVDPTLTYSSAPAVPGETPAFSGALARDPGEDVGAYAIRQGSLTLRDNGGFKASNYTLEYAGDYLTVTPLEIVVTADGKTKTYGSDDPDLTYGSTQGVNGETPAFTGALEREPGKDVGVYPIGQGTLALADNGAFKASNYALRYVGDNLTIFPAPIELRADDLTKRYGDPDPDLTYAYAGGMLGEVPAFSGALEREAGEAVGAYEILQGSVKLADQPGFMAKNYVLSYVPGTFTIRSVDSGSNPIRVDGFDGEYDGDEHGVTVTGTQPGDILYYRTSEDEEWTTTPPTRTDVSDTTVYVKAVDPEGNYEDRFGEAEIAIRPAKIVVSADPDSKRYGDEDPDWTYRHTDGVKDEKPAFTGDQARVPGESTGIYDIEQGSLALADDPDTLFKADNYELVYEKAPFEILGRVIYDGNGHTEGEPPVDGNAYAQNAEVTVLAEGDLKRDGAVFLGWSLMQYPLVTSKAAEDALTRLYAGDTFAFAGDEMIVYAVWAVNEHNPDAEIPDYYEHQVRYDANGGTGEVPEDDNYYVRGQEADPLFDKLPDKEGYSFAGWSEDPDALTPTYTEDELKTILMGDEDVTLYAVYTINEYQYTVRYYRFGVANANFLGEADRVAVYGETVDITDDETLNAYWEAGWNRAAATTGAIRVTADPDRNILNVVYTGIVSAYRIEYYYDGALDAAATVVGQDLVGTVINNYPAKGRANFRFSEAVGLPMTVTADGAAVIRVYYVHVAPINVTELIEDYDIPLGFNSASLNVGDCVE